MNIKGDAKTKLLSGLYFEFINIIQVKFMKLMFEGVNIGFRRNFIRKKVPDRRRTVKKATVELV